MMLGEVLPRAAARRDPSGERRGVIVRMDRLLFRALVATERDAMTAAQAANVRTERAALEAAARGDAFVLMRDGYAMVGGALYLHRRGRAELWCLISKFARKRDVVMATREVRRLLDEKQSDPTYASVEAYLRDEPEFNALAFARAVGFETICYLERWDEAGRDHLFCRRLRP